MGFPRQEYWSGLPSSSLGNLPDPETEPKSPILQADCLPLSHQGNFYYNKNFFFFFFFKNAPGRYIWNTHGDFSPRVEPRFSPSQMKSLCLDKVESGAGSPSFSHGDPLRTKFFLGLTVFPEFL